MLIAANKAVSIDYTLTNDAGEVIDSSAGGAPLVYLQGAGNIIPGLEKALEGKQAGDELNVSIEPEDAYGEYLAELVSTLNRSMFEGVDELEVGMQFHASAPDGQMQIVTIRDATGRVLRRAQYDELGRELVLIDDLEPEEWVDVRDLPRPKHKACGQCGKAKCCQWRVNSHGKADGCPRRKNDKGDKRKEMGQGHSASP